MTKQEIIYNVDKFLMGKKITFLEEVIKGYRSYSDFKLIGTSFNCIEEIEETKENKELTYFIFDVFFDEDYTKYVNILFINIKNIDNKWDLLNFKNIPDEFIFKYESMIGIIKTFEDYELMLKNSI